jgi:hypothetical protein
MRLTRERCYMRAAPESVAVSAPLLWLSPKDWGLAAGSALLPSIPVCRLVRD